MMTFHMRLEDMPLEDSWNISSNMILLIGAPTALLCLTLLPMDIAISYLSYPLFELQCLTTFPPFLLQRHHTIHIFIMF